MLRENGQELRGVPLLEPASLRATTDHPRRFVVAQLTIAAGRSKNVTDKPGQSIFIVPRNWLLNKAAETRDLRFPTLKFCCCFGRELGPFDKSPQNR